MALSEGPQPPSSGSPEVLLMLRRTGLARVPPEGGLGPHEAVLFNLLHHL